MLVASLPQLPGRFDAGRLPISWPALLNRLSMLDHDDRQITRLIGMYFLWDRQPLDRTDDEVIARYRELLHNSSNYLVRHLIRTRTEIRLLISALRRHRTGAGPPTWDLRHTGSEMLASHVCHHWNEPSFGLGFRHRWLETFIRSYDAGEMREAQRVVFNERWHDWTRIAEKYTFTFEAVIVYLVRWEIVDRWTSQNADAGKTRFAKLIEETLGEYANPV